MFFLEFQEDSSVDVQTKQRLYKLSAFFSNHTPSPDAAETAPECQGGRSRHRTQLLRFFKTSFLRQDIGH